MADNTLPKRPKNLGVKCVDCQTFTARFCIQTAYGIAHLCLTCATIYGDMRAADARAEKKAQERERLAASVMEAFTTMLHEKPSADTTAMTLAEFLTQPISYVAMQHCGRSGLVNVSDPYGMFSDAMNKGGSMVNPSCQDCHVHYFMGFGSLYIPINF